jgi:hypothetical protein
LRQTEVRFPTQQIPAKIVDNSLHTATAVTPGKNAILRRTTAESTSSSF